MAPPVHPSLGFSGFFGLAPANCASAETAPAMFWLSNVPNAPLHSESTATLMGDLLPPVSCLTGA